MDKLTIIVKIRDLADALLENRSETIFCNNSGIALKEYVPIKEFQDILRDILSDLEGNFPDSETRGKAKEIIYKLLDHSYSHKVKKQDKIVL